MLLRVCVVMMCGRRGVTESVVVMCGRRGGVTESVCGGDVW